MRTQLVANVRDVIFFGIKKPFPPEVAEARAFFHLFDTKKSMAQIWKGRNGCFVACEFTVHGVHSARITGRSMRLIGAPEIKKAVITPIFVGD